VSDDERPESLAQQAASWVPPWERQQRPPDRRFQAEAEDAARAAAGDERDAPVGDEQRVEDEQPVGDEQPDDDEQRFEAGLTEDDDDFDEAFEGTNPPGYAEHDADPEPEPVAVDQPDGLDAGETEPEPSAAEIGPELPVPDAVAEAAEAADGEEGAPADAPLPEDGDDAGEVFDRAADDDVSDDGVDDEPVVEEPGVEEPAVEEPAVELPAAEDGPAGPGAVAVPEQGRPQHDLPAVVDAPTRTSEELLDLADDDELCAALEAILLVVDEPVAEMQLAQILEQPTERVAAMLENISARYTAAGHGFDLRRAAGGWRLYTRPEYAAYVERFVLDGQSVRLTQAALETLAVVAYKQPVTRSRISAIRGVNCDGVMRTLVTRGLIEECGIEGETGAHLYRTTPLFLEKLGLNSVDQLPPLAPFLPDDVEEVLDAPG
jgi:segregation and condensation protein B